MSSMEQQHTNLYLDPATLTPNEANLKARPGETAEQRTARVAAMKESIEANGQRLPVQVVEVEDKDDEGQAFVRYEYVDGGSRVDACVELGKPAWCVLIDGTQDLYRAAVTTNMHAVQNSPLQMAHIIQEAIDRHGWKGRGGQKRVAEYLSIAQPRVSEYLSLLHAPAAVREVLQAGNLVLDAALTLMRTPEESTDEVYRDAQAIAELEEEAKRFPRNNGKKRKGGVNDDAAADAEQSSDDKAATSTNTAAEEGEEQHKPLDSASDTSAAPKKKAKVQAKHVEAAMRDKGIANPPRTKAAFVTWLEGISSAAYSPAAVKWADYVREVWFAGKGTDRKLTELFDAATTNGPKAKLPKAPKPVKAATAKKATKPVKPGASMKVAKKGKGK